MPLSPVYRMDGPSTLGRTYLYNLGIKKELFIMEQMISFVDLRWIQKDKSTETPHKFFSILL